MKRTVGERRWVGGDDDQTKGPERDHMKKVVYRFHVVRSAF